ncbi:hypothetical protein VB780_30535 [Leptolyngbya sp. CCNP1308]|uniref:hypothetical protein n=1 Tax=Leptolyngbya sp. CCNP1308 TaxID=3110255 RepID=UPI002B208906|nr:hypothetical protein [Leptolyngbya sp. CCNP1308]MEA5452948.1 hypothetical protein [Leptolyngbya sp. CCNP1308]
MPSFIYLLGIILAWYSLLKLLRTDLRWLAGQIKEQLHRLQRWRRQCGLKN